LYRLRTRPGKHENITAGTVALGYFAYNFIKINRTIRVTAMAAGVTPHLLDVLDLVRIWESWERESKKAA